MTAVDCMTSTADLERQTKSPSPLSFWTEVSPNTSPPTNRTVFTIVDDHAENSPRPPKPELSQLEAKGMVNLSSQWTGEEETNMNIIVSPQNKHHPSHQQQPGKRVNFSFQTDHESQIFNGDTNHVIDCNDDGLVIVTDKNTQTEQPWPYLAHPSSESTQRGDHDTTKNIPFSCNNTTNINNSKINDGATHDNSNTCKESEENTRDNNVTDSRKQNGEAPTLKVEYVGKVWDAYINDFLLASDHISEAAIYDKDTKTCISCSLQFAMHDEEFSHLLLSINCLSVAYRQGVTINNQHFKTVLADGRRGLMAKSEERDGCSACQTRTLVLIAMHDRRAKGRRCNDELMRLGDFFWAKGL